MAVTNVQLIVLEVTTTRQTPSYDEMARDIQTMIAKSNHPGWMVSVDSAWVDTKRRYQIGR